MRIKNSEKFYQLLHELEDDNPIWYKHVGLERKPNVYLDDVNDLTEVDPEKAIVYRAQLKQLREMLKSSKWNYRTWRTPAKRAALRLIVTYYRNFGLSTREISNLLEMSPSTLRHSYPPLAEKEQLRGYKVALHDKYGRPLNVKDL